MSSRTYLKKVLKMTHEFHKVGQSQHGDHKDGDNLIQNDYWEDVELGDAQEIHLNKLIIDEQGEQLEVASLTDSEIREFDLDFIEGQGDTNTTHDMNLQEYRKNAQKFYRDVVNLDPLYGGGSGLDVANKGDPRVATPSAAVLASGEHRCYCDVCMGKLVESSLDNVEGGGELYDPSKIIDGNSCVPLAASSSVDLTFDGKFQTLMEINKIDCDGLEDVDSLELTAEETSDSVPPEDQSSLYQSLGAVSPEVSSSSHHSPEGASANCDVTEHASCQPPLHRTGCHTMASVGIPSVSSGPDSDFSLGTSNIDRGNVDDRIFRAKNLCKEDCHNFSYMKQLFYNAFSNCQLCDKQLQYTPKRWTLLNIKNKSRLIYDDRNHLCESCAEFLSHDIS